VVPADLLSPDIEEVVEALRPDLVVHSAALTDADRCQMEPDAAFRLNAEATTRLARAASHSCRRFLYCSTDLVFDGGRSFYREGDPVEPILAYGRTKREGEQRAEALLGHRAVILRLALLFGLSGGGRRSFAERMVRDGQNGQPVKVFSDQFRSPLYVEDAATGIEHLLGLGETPRAVHLGGPERVSRYDMGRTAAQVFGFSPALAVPTRMAEVPSAAPRPADVSLDVSLARSIGFEPRTVEAGFRAMREAWVVDASP
jgi:dTDP-4-dehydrorhamnose reductase